MYKINKVTNIIKDGEEIDFYGVESELLCYSDISSNKKAVEELCKLLNAVNADKSNIEYIIDDFFEVKV